MKKSPTVGQVSVLNVMYDVASQRHVTTVGHEWFDPLIRSLARYLGGEAGSLRRDYDRANEVPLRKSECQQVMRPKSSVSSLR